VYYLVQNLTRRNDDRRESGPAGSDPAEKGFDDLFGAEYMGSAEFEFGLSRAYKKMRELPLKLFPVEVTRAGTTRTLYFIGADVSAAFTESSVSSLDEAIEAFKRWFSEPRLKTKERTYFDLHFEDSVDDRVMGRDVVAWWSIRDNIVWTLDEATAQELLGAFDPT
jgi:hypothetical protein